MKEMTRMVRKQKHGGDTDPDLSYASMKIFKNLIKKAPLALLV